MNYLLILLFTFSVVFGEDLSQRLDKLIQDKQIKQVTVLRYNPFFTKKEEKQIRKTEMITKKSIKNTRLRLITIFNNKAFINDRWLGKNDKIYGYRVKEISANSVTLNAKNKNIILRFQKTKEILKVRKQ
jgi:hypothetical protein